MHVTVRSTKKKIPITPDEEVRVPWRPETLVSFAATVPALSDLEADEIDLPGFHVGLYRGHLTALTQKIMPPSVIIYSAAQLLDNAAFKGVADRFSHPTGWIEDHPNLWQIPAGQVGGGAILVRDATVMTYGRRNGLPESAEARAALQAQHTAALLEALGYVQSHAAGPLPTADAGR